MINRRTLLRSALAAPALWLPSQEIVRPANAWSHGAAVPVPDPAAQWGYNTRTFFDGFDSISTIDINNTQAPGFKWYLANGWPNASSNDPFHDIRIATPTRPHCVVSVANSILELSGFTGDPNTELGFQTACANGAGYNGQGFAGGGYFEFSFAADISLRNSTLGWPSAVNWPLDWLLGTQSDWVEFDLFEMYVDGSLFYDGLQDRVTTLTTIVSQNTNTNDGWTAPSGVNLLNFNTYGILWVPAAKNGGTGLVRRYFNRAYLPSQDVFYTATGPASPGASPANPNGTFFFMDRQTFMLNLSWGHNWPSYWDYFEVWQ
jgi:hypothetical protein